MVHNLSNPSLLKEWDKIKDFNIFSSLDEFALLYFSKPNGKCFRKYANYPWSKENFFFGSYDELSSFLKCTTEIPFYLTKKIGSKVYSLTILSFFRDENRKLFAHCKCDCGNETIKSYDAITKGNAHSCGCNKTHQKKSVSTLYDTFPEIVEKYWDYEKNTVDPKQVPITSTEKYWWKGYNATFQMPIQSLAHNISGTSFPEQAIYFFLEKHNIEVIHRYKIHFEDRNYELDLFLPEYNVAIEYDGSFWHKEKKKIDNRKNDAIANLNISLIRIREKGLSKTGITKGIEICLKKSLTNEALADIINKIFDYLKELSGKDFSFISAEDISHNKLNIQKRYTLYYQEDNVANSWMSAYWAKNNIIEPYLISTSSSQKVFFECHHGAKFYYSPKYMSFKKRENRHSQFDECFFAQTALCRRADQIAKGLDLKILRSSFNGSNVFQIDFLIKNQTPTSFYPLDPRDNLILLNGEKYHSNINNKCHIISQEAVSIPKTAFFPCEPLELLKARATVDIEPFSQKNYSVSFSLKKTQLSENLDILLLLELNDTCNWIYQVCIHVHKDGLTISHNAQILTHQMLINVISNNYISDSSERIPNKKGMYNIIDYLKKSQNHLGNKDE